MKSPSERRHSKLQYSSFKFILFNSIVCGLEFCASAGFTYIPPLLLKGKILGKFLGQLFRSIFAEMVRGILLEKGRWLSDASTTRQINLSELYIGNLGKIHLLSPNFSFFALTAGVSEQWMGITLGIGPFLGFLFVPFLGHASDRLSDSAPLGKRKPFILALCSLLFLSLIAIPHCGHFVHRRLSDELGHEAAAAVPTLEAGISASSAGWTLPLGLATFLLCLSVVLFDFSSQVCLSPCEALLSDISSPTHQNDQVRIGIKVRGTVLLLTINITY